jgi:hypothetical protein
MMPPESQHNLSFLGNPPFSPPLPRYNPTLGDGFDTEGHFGSRRTEADASGRSTTSTG